MSDIISSLIIEYKQYEDSDKGQFYKLKKQYSYLKVSGKIRGTTYKQKLYYLIIQ